MRPNSISDRHFEQITFRNRCMMVSLTSGGSATLSVTVNVPVEAAVIKASIHHRVSISLINIDRDFAEWRNLPNASLPASVAFSAI
jgi:hypothetical protein